MKILLLLSLSLAGVLGQATPAPSVDPCLTGEFMADGYTTGQNIELDYGATAMSIDANGDSQISVGFLVPKVYTTGYDASAYSITFNRDHTVNALVKDATVGQATANQNACFTNRFANDTQCALGLNPAVWTNNGPQGLSQCVDQTIMTIGWSEAMTNGAFGNTDITDDGTVTRVYVTATVETWRKFHQTADPLTYLGQMNGNVQRNTNGMATGRVGTHGRSGTHYGDGGDLDVEFGPLEMNDWRYTLYQIPFYLVFPKTVIVETSFTIGTQVAVLNGVVSQDVITVNFNPNNAAADNFAVLDVVVTTMIQYPYGIRGPQDNISPMKQYVGDNGDDCQQGQGCAAHPHAATIEFESFDDSSVCSGHMGVCKQDFKLRIVPDTSTPCSVAGDYYLEFWADCVNGGQLPVQGGPNGCSLDKELGEQSLATKRTSNGFFDLVFTVAHQSFCPEVMDTVKVAVDLKAYHDEAFTQQISNAYNGIPTDYNANADVVYSNDIIYYEATYRTASFKSTQLDINGDLLNNQDTPGNDDIIDYVRAIKIFVDVTLGESSQGTAVTGWDPQNTGNWKDNVSWLLGGTRVPGPGEDFDDSAQTVTGARVLQVPASQPATSAHWRMIMCEVAYIDPAVPIMTGVKPADCFTAETDIAHNFFDFDKVMSSKVPADPLVAQNFIDENEIAFKMRLDERVIPVGPLTDNSHITVTVESEVYYIGNQHPTRRLLQAGQQNYQKQQHVKSMQHNIYYKNPKVAACALDDKLTKANLDLSLDFSKSGKAPTTPVEANTFAMNMKMQIESALNTKDAVFVTMVKGKNGILLDSKKPGSRRRMAKGDITYVELVIKSTKTTSAGKIANAIQSEIKMGKFKTVDAFNEADVVSMTSTDCATAATHNQKLASSAGALSALFAFFLAAAAFAL